MEEFAIGTRVLYHRNGIKYIGTILERDECYAVVKFDNPHAFCDEENSIVCGLSELTTCNKDRKENTIMENENMFNGMFGKIAKGMCRLSMSGGIAVRTSSGYKSFNVKTGRLTNCENFVFNSVDEFFFVIPTNKVTKGDIILVNGKPKCVLEAEKNKISVINYEDSTIETIVPERHVFMGNTYFYGKIVSMFGDNFNKGKNGINKVMSYMMMTEMMKGADSGSSMSAMLPFMMMNNIGAVFENIFGFDNAEEDSVDEVDEEEQSTESEE